MFQIGDANCALRFERSDADGFPQFTVTARFRCTTLVHDGLYFDQVDRFLTDFDAFERTRRGSALLVAEPDFQLEIQPDGPSGHAWVSFRLRRERYLGSSQATESHMGTTTIAAGFALPGEFLARALHDFQRYFQGPKVV